jgi:hypothetical protein
METPRRRALTDEQAQYGSQPLPSSLRAFDLASIRKLGIDATMRVLRCRRLSTIVELLRNLA